MVNSMTGFGRASYSIDERQYNVEIKSVNNRYSDISIKMPRNISFLEDTVRKAQLNACKTNEPNSLERLIIDLNINNHSSEDVENIYGVVYDNTNGVIFDKLDKNITYIF